MQNGYSSHLEFIVRHYLAGSAWRRFQRGELTAEQLGIEDEAVYGQRLTKPLVEVTTKFEAYDRFVDREEALKSLTSPMKNLIQLSKHA